MFKPVRQGQIGRCGPLVEISTDKISGPRSSWRPSNGRCEARHEYAANKKSPDQAA